MGGRTASLTEPRRVMEGRDGQIPNVGMHFQGTFKRSKLQNRKLKINKSQEAQEDKHN